MVNVLMVVLVVVHALMVPVEVGRSPMPRKSLVLKCAKAPLNRLTRSATNMNRPDMPSSGVGAAHAYREGGEPMDISAKTTGQMPQRF